MLDISLSNEIDGQGCDAQSFLKMYGIPLWLLIVVVNIVGLSVVCEEYLVDTVEYYSNRFELRGDVAGATLLAAGSSFPEVFAALFGAFLQKTSDNPGPGTNVGSACFNISFIVSLSAFVSPKEVDLDIWGTSRDSIFFLASILLIGCFYSISSPNEIELWEALLLLILYLIYVFSVLLNDTIFSFFLNKTRAHSLTREVSMTELGQESEDSGGYHNPLSPLDDSQLVDQQGSISKAFLNIYRKCASPWRYILELTIPSESKAWRMVCSLLWVGVITFLMIDFATKVGTCMGLSTNAMGLTILAAGTSLPDAFNSVAVAKSGKGAMAVSNALGSNIFDLLFALGLPWALESLFHEGRPVAVDSDDISVFVIAMLVELTVYLGSLTASGFRLKRWLVYPLLLSFAAYTSFAIITDF